MTYYKTAKNASDVKTWEPCKANTLTASKREAQLTFGHGRVDDIVSVGVDSGGYIDTVSERRNGKWTDL
jgi:hypothetical protein